MPGGASGDARPASRGLKTTSRSDARRRGTSADARPAKTVPGRKAGKDHARSQGPEERPGTQGCLRQEGNELASHLRWPVFASQRPVSPSARPVPAAPGKRAAEGWTLGRAWTRWVEQRAACRGERLFARNGSSVPVFRRDFITPTWPTSSSDSGLLRQKREEPYFERTVLRSDAARPGSWAAVPSSRCKLQKRLSVNGPPSSEKSVSCKCQDASCEL